MTDRPSLRDEMSIFQAIKMWNLIVLDCIRNEGIHPEGIYYPRNVKNQFLLEWGDEIAPFLRGDFPYLNRSLIK